MGRPGVSAEAGSNVTSLGGGRGLEGVDRHGERFLSLFRVGVLPHGDWVSAERSELRGQGQPLGDRFAQGLSLPQELVPPQQQALSAEQEFLGTLGNLQPGAGGLRQRPEIANRQQGGAASPACHGQPPFERPGGENESWRMQDPPVPGGHRTRNSPSLEIEFAQEPPSRANLTTRAAEEFGRLPPGRAQIASPGLQPGPVRGRKPFAAGVDEGEAWGVPFHLEAECLALVGELADAGLNAFEPLGGGKLLRLLQDRAGGFD